MKYGNKVFLLSVGAVGIVAAIGTPLLLLIVRKNSTDFSSSEFPSFQPSNEPSTNPSDLPTMASDAPSQTPSVLPSKSPSFMPSFEPSTLPSLVPSTTPSKLPSLFPTLAPSETPFPSMLVNFSSLPSAIPSFEPSETPSTDSILQPGITNNTTEPNQGSTTQPTGTPTEAPSELPTTLPTNFPTRIPTQVALPLPTSVPTADTIVGVQDQSNEARFYAIGDVPYSTQEAVALIKQIEQLPQDAEFLIHVGDIRSARDGRSCEIEEYYNVASILNQSHVPVFMVMGDNEWNDCPNVFEAYDHWITVFGNFEDHWDHSFNVIRQDSRGENFAFVHQRTLFVGLNLVGGRVHRPLEWEERLSDQVEWIKQLVSSRILSDPSQADTVVIFGHANPSDDHSDFFLPLRNYLRDDLENTVPFLYLNGDAHAWNYRENFYDQSNFLRMQVEGGTRDPPLQVTVRSKFGASTREVFSHDRMLELLEI